MTLSRTGTGLFSEPPKVSDSDDEPSRIKRILIAMVLSLLVPGLGQVYERKPRRGLVIAFGVAFMSLMVIESRLWSTFTGLIGSFVVSFLVRLWVVADSVLLARRKRTGQPRPTEYVIAVAVLLVLGAYPTPDLMVRYSPFHAFKVSSGSMCPTICLGDRMIADMRAYKTQKPQRGEVALFDRDGITGKLSKRIAAIAGDTVASDTDGTIIVNGLAFAPRTEACGYREPPRNISSEIYLVKPFKVPTDTVFMIGDDFDNSYDSRHFGPVPVSTLAGKPLFIYWSPTRSRIACKIR